jgi:hypothetical protein
MSIMAQLYGDFLAAFPPNHNALTLTFSPGSAPLQQRWRNNRLAAHFVAEYFAHLLPLEAQDPSSQQRMQARKGAVSYVANELLENAMKFHDPEANVAVQCGIHLLDDPEVTAIIFTTNSIKPAGVDKFQAFITALLAADPTELYMQHMEDSVAAESPTSGLGLLTLINDYGARLGWKFDVMHGDRLVVIVTTMAQIKV